MTCNSRKNTPSLGAGLFTSVLHSRGTYCFVQTRSSELSLAEALRASILANGSTHTDVSPVFLDAFLKLSTADSSELRGVTLAVGGAAPRPQHWIWAETNGVRLLQAPGSTEVGPWGTSARPAGIVTLEAPIDAVWAREDVQTQLENIVYSDDEVEDGELVIIGPFLLNKYLKHPGTRDPCCEAVVFHAFRTGDIFRRHKKTNGLIYKCRVDDLIPLASGEKVPALHCEALLESRIGIETACMVGDQIPREEDDFALLPSADVFVVVEVEEWVIAEDQEGTVMRAIESYNACVPEYSRVKVGYTLILSPERKLPRTRKGTLWRKRVWKDYESAISAKIRAIAGAPSDPVMLTASLKQALAKYFAAELGISEDILLAQDHPTFEEAGLTSLGMRRVASRVAALLSRDIDLSVFWSCADVEQLAHALTSQTKFESRSQSVTARSSHKRVNFNGVACRLPGGLDCPAKVWHSLRGVSDPNECHTADVSARWGQTTMDTDDVNEKVKRARWLKEDTFTDFDFRTFGLSLEQAEHVSPAVRLALHVVYEALESAGLTPQDCGGLPNSPGNRLCTGVWAAQNDTSGIKILKYEKNGFNMYGRNHPLGASEAALAGRISHSFGFHGPSVVVQAACASSLVALHQGGYDQRKARFS